MGKSKKGWRNMVPVRRELVKLASMPQAVHEVTLNLLDAVSELNEAIDYISSTTRTLMTAVERYPDSKHDWATDRPIHNGLYVVWFVLKDRVLPGLVRKEGEKWFSTGKGAMEISFSKSKPDYWQYVINLSEDDRAFALRRKS